MAARPPEDAPQARRRRRRCPYCGALTFGEACGSHADLLAVDSARGLARDWRREALESPRNSSTTRKEANER